MARDLARHGWHLTPLWEHGEEEGSFRGDPIESQFPPENPTETASSAVFAEFKVPGRRPAIQFNNLTAEFFKFDADFIGDPSISTRDPEDARRTVIEMRKRLKAATQIAPGINRPRRYLFEWGHIGFTCYVISIGPIKYSETHRYGAGVIQHHAAFSIELRVLEPQDEAVIQSRNAGYEEPVSENSEYTVKDGDTYESIADEIYGDPTLGVPLREQNERASPLSGTTISLLDEHLLRRMGLAPASVMAQLRRGDVASAVNGLASTRIRWDRPGIYAKTPSSLLPNRN